MTTLNIQKYAQFTSGGGVTYAVLMFQATEVVGQPFTTTNIQIGTPQNLSSSPFPTFVTADDGLAYYESVYCNQLMSNINTSAGFSVYSAFDVETVVPAVNVLFQSLKPVAFSGNASDLTNDAGFVNVSGLATALSSYPTSATVASAYVPKTTTVNGHALSANVTVTASDVGAPSGSGTSTGANTGDQTLPSIARTTSTFSLSLTGSGATGTQVHATKDSTVRLNLSASNTSSIGGPATSLIAVKYCATNSSTEGDWTTVATLENDQTITLAIALQSVQLIKGQISLDIPGGWYVKAVASGTGTHAETSITGQKTIYG